MSVDAPGVIVRKATPDDAGAVCGVHEAGWRAGYGHLFDPDVLEQGIREHCTRWPAVLAGEGYEGTTLLVAEEEGEIVGFAHVGPYEEDPAVAWIHSFYVHPDRWGSGVAAALMARCLELLAGQGYAVVSLETWERTERARRFYEKAGFAPTGRKFVSRVAGRAEVVDAEYSRPTRPRPSWR